MCHEINPRQVSLNLLTSHISHAHQMTSPSNSSESDDAFFMLSEDLIPSAPPDLPARISLDFSGLLDPPLILESDRKEGCGGQLWPAGKALAKYLLQCKMDELRGKTMFVRSDVFSLRPAERKGRWETHKK